MCLGVSDREIEDMERKSFHIHLVFLCNWMRYKAQHFF